MVLSAGVHPQYREVVRTYTQGMGLDIRGDEQPDASAEEPGGALRRFHRLRRACRTPTSSAGSLPRRVSPALRKGSTRAARSSSWRPTRSPWGSWCRRVSCGADVVVGEGQALGNSLAFGGPYLGFFAFRREHIRRSSGRIAGETVDRGGTRGYVFTLSTREQHIRREKATSNICTNQSLNALAAAVYMASLGPRGLRRSRSCAGTRRTTPRDRIAELPGFAVADGRVLPRVRGALPAAGRGHQPPPVRRPAASSAGYDLAVELSREEELHARVLHGDDQPRGDRPAGRRR